MLDPLNQQVSLNVNVTSTFLQKVNVTTGAFSASSNTLIKIMPLGDSLTWGVQGKEDRDSGEYRPELWQRLVAQGLNVEFVGSQSDGSELGSQAHEGHPGWTIKQIEESVSTWLAIYQPDLILLMIGTNDTRKNSVGNMVVQFSKLIDRIVTASPKAQLLVASIPPIHPSKHSVRRIIQTVAFNRGIAWLVNFKMTQSKKVTFVDMTSLTINDLTSSLPLGLDNGIHPHAEGYRKIAHVWYEAILKAINKWSFVYRFPSPISLKSNHSPALKRHAQ